MKKIFFGMFLALALFCAFFCTNVFAQNYSVKLSFSLLSEDSDFSGWITVDEATLAELIAFGNVEYYEEDGLAQLDEYTENDPSISLMWGHKTISSEPAWGKGAFGTDVTVAVIDSGASEHIELEGRIKYKKNYFDNSQDVTDNINHGTAVAGVIASNRGNGALGSGVAPRCSLAILKVADKVNGVQMGPYISDISDAIRDAVNIYGCSVINLSLGADKEYFRLREAVNYAVSKGAVIVSSSGNDYSSTLRYPASYKNVIGVSAVDSSGKWAAFSNYNEGVDVSAPGNSVFVLSNMGYNAYTYKSGTSFASPHVAGICAAMLSANPELSRNEIESIIKKCAVDDEKNDGYDVYYGYGIASLEKCIDEVIKNCGVYISKIDKEDSEKPYFVTNVSVDAENFILAVQKNDNTNVYVPFTAKKGQSCEIPMKDTDISSIKNVFVIKNENQAFSISKSADFGLSLYPFNTAKDLSAFVSDSGGKILVSLSGLDFAKKEKCNITVECDGKTVYLNECTGLSGNAQIAFDMTPQTLMGYGTNGVKFTVTLWGDNTSVSKEFVFARAGDINEDGKITTDDLLIIRKLVAGLSEIENFRFFDVNLDGNINSDDIVYLRKVLAGIV